VCKQYTFNISTFVDFIMCKDLDLLKGKLAESPDAAHDLILALVVRVAVRRRLSQQCENNNLNKP
jgi:hypothetical protein